MQNQTPFQIAVLAIFVVMFIVGFLGFSGKIPFPGKAGEINYGEVTFWGTIPASLVGQVFADEFKKDKKVTINYVYKNKDTITRDLTEALARGEGPDIFMLPQDEMLKTINKVGIIPYQNYPERLFKDTFIEGGELFLKPDGIVALPFLVDPLVMYWNRDIFTNAGIILPPQRWSQFYGIAPGVVVKNQKNDITRSFVSFGEYQNVTHAKDILATLIMQAGSSIVISNDKTLRSDVALDSSAQSPSARAVSFYTEFSRQEKDTYSWNRSLPESRSMFEAGDLAVYFGYASEYNAIRERNPHLNFDIAVMPQADQTQKKITFANMQAVAVTKATKNPAGAVYGAVLLTNSSVIQGVSKAVGLPPVRRDLLISKPNDAVFSVFYDSALISRAWADPSPDETNKLFRNMINDISGGQRKVSESLSILQSGMSKLLVQYQN